MKALNRPQKGDNATPIKLVFISTGHNWLYSSYTKQLIPVDLIPYSFVFSVFNF